ncbi:MAG: hypothetical protein AB9M53_04405 [Leptothrix sp. (in: b-proteobacteria)]
MTRATTLKAALLAAVALTALTGCGEKPQNLVTTKKDVQAYLGTTNGYQAAGWEAGDATSWNQQVRTRGQWQNEYQRMGGRR